jgi:Ion channel
MRWVVQSRRNPSAILLSVQLLGMLVYPFLEGTEVGRIAFGVFGIAVLIFTTRMVRTTPGLTWVSAGIALPAILLQIVQPVLLAVSAGLEAVFYFYAAGSLIAYMMADRHATTDELFAAGATFTLIAWAFTWLYILLQALRPGSFGAAVNPEQLRSWTELMYLSFALLSSTGIGDVIPLSPVTRAVAAIEMFVGVRYLAAVVSRLIGLTLIQHRPPGET